MTTNKSISARLLGSSPDPEEMAEVIAAHLRHSPLPDYANQPLVTETALRERCAVVLVTPVVEGDATGSWVVIFNDGAEMCLTQPSATYGEALVVALHHVLTHKSPLT